VRRKYDGLRNITEVRFLDVDGDLREGPGLVAIIQTDWDAEGRVLEQRFFGANEQPTAEPGAARVSNQYDEIGLLIERRYYDVDGAPRKGIAINRFSYNSRGQPEELEQLDENGDPARGAAMIRYVYDQNGILVERRSFDGDGDPSKPPLWAVARNIYNERGQLTTTTYLDSEGRVLTPGGR
jgi:hypothetical protein